jgi:hypothetical protein
LQSRGEWTAPYARDRFAHELLEWRVNRSKLTQQIADIAIACLVSSATTYGGI